MSDFKLAVDENNKAWLEGLCCCPSSWSLTALQPVLTCHPPRVPGSLGEATELPLLRICGTVQRPDRSRRLLLPSKPQTEDQDHETLIGGTGCGLGRGGTRLLTWHGWQLVVFLASRASRAQDLAGVCIACIGFVQFFVGAFPAGP